MKKYHCVDCGTNSIYKKVKLLADKYGIEMPKVSVNISCDHYLCDAYIEYTHSHDTCEMFFSVGHGAEEKDINKNIAHEFAHAMSREMSFMQTLTLQRTENCPTLDAVFCQLIEKVAKRLEPIFIKDLEALS